MMRAHTQVSRARILVPPSPGVATAVLLRRPGRRGQAGLCRALDASIEASAGAAQLQLAGRASAHLGTAAPLHQLPPSVLLLPASPVTAILTAVATSSILLSIALMLQWQLQRGRADRAEKETELLKSQLSDRQDELSRLRGELAKQAAASEQLSFLQHRLDQAAKEQLKLERALELKDGQLESFMVVAQRQIKMLEERCKVLVDKGWRD
ncbi:hypothetical protein QJQ45_000033 [Haematococcus lacustris]|nr:hypothetical protein QJQ45_000033 [Haematococcus lacustris]